MKYFPRESFPHSKQRYIEYDEYYDKIRPQLPDEIKTITNYFGMHDCGIVASYFIGKDFRLELNTSTSERYIVDTSPGVDPESDDRYRTIKNITFTNAKILEGDADLGDFWWLYEEIHILPDSYELHVFFGKFINDDLAELTITFDSVILELLED